MTRALYRESSDKWLPQKKTENIEKTAANYVTVNKNIRFAWITKPSPSLKILPLHH